METNEKRNMEEMIWKTMDDTASAYLVHKKSSEFRGAERCSTLRRYDGLSRLLDTVKESNFDEAILAKDIMKGYLTGKYQLKDFRGLIDEGLDDDQMMLGEQRDGKAKRLYSILERAALAEKRHASLVKRAKVYAGNYEVTVTPDVLFRTAHSVELVLYRIGKPTVTKDGVTIELVANIGKPEDVEKVLQYDAEGIGLFRTEFLFMDRVAMPTEEEQFEAYKTVAEKMEGKPVIIRTLDIGGDKEIPYMGLEKDENPFLGYRAIRFCLDRKDDVYRPQLRALLRASAYGNIRIMIPMVTCLDEYREAKALIEEIKKELDGEGIAYKKDIQVGIMVETAAASLMADAFAKEVDFFSIGTNDLTQYTMSVDRGNDKVSYLYSPLNPAVLRSIKRVITCAREAGIMVGMCGEAASDPMMIPLLLAFGLNEFSMSASAILYSRKLITNYSIEELQAVADKAMSFVTVKEVEDYMRAFIG